MSYSKLHRIPKPVTIGQAVFNLPTGRMDKRILTVAELPNRQIPGEWDLSVVDLVAVLDDLPEGYQVIIKRNNEAV